jgi:hypothetical protein
VGTPILISYIRYIDRCWFFGNGVIQLARCGGYRRQIKDPSGLCVVSRTLSNGFDLENGRQSRVGDFVLTHFQIVAAVLKYIIKNFPRSGGGGSEGLAGLRGDGEL